MAIPIAPINGIAPAAVQRAGSASEVGKSGGSDFGDLLGDAIDRAAATETEALDTANKFAAGDKNVGIHEVMISAEKAGIEVRFVSTLKNKILGAYRELMNTQV